MVPIRQAVFTLYAWKLPTQPVLLITHHYMIRFPADSFFLQTVETKKVAWIKRSGRQIKLYVVSCFMIKTKQKKKEIKGHYKNK